jgi:hypothetical protein
MIAIVVQKIRIAPDKKRTVFFVRWLFTSLKFIAQLYDKLVHRDLNDVGAALTCKESPSATRRLGLSESNEIQSPIAFPVRFPSVCTL